MILKNKNAVIYGAGGSLGSSVAKAFATAGANVFLTGHRPEAIRKTADALSAGGGSLETGVTVDVTCGTTAGLNYRSATPTFARAR